MNGIYNLRIWKEYYGREPGFEPIWLYRANCDEIKMNTFGHTPDEALQRMGRLIEDDIKNTPD